MQESRFTIRVVQWNEAEPDIRFIRETVFMGEQGVPEDLEWDGLDPACVHVLALDPDEKPIATGRMTAGGRIGRMAVLGPWRARGVGDLILITLLREARRRALRRVTLAAQTHAIPFYERHGFIGLGEVFPDADIPHMEMALDL